MCLAKCKHISAVLHNSIAVCLLSLLDRCRGLREPLDKLNQRLLAYNPDAVTDGTAAVAAMRHVTADSGFTLRAAPLSCGEARAIDAPCIGGGGGFDWTSAGGIIVILIICIALLALALARVLVRAAATEEAVRPRALRGRVQEPGDGDRGQKGAG